MKLFPPRIPCKVLIKSLARRALVAVLASLMFALPAFAAEPLCHGLVQHKQSLAVPRVGKPPFGRYYREPAFATKVMRISNARSGEVVKPMYSTVQAWNADESLLILFHRDAGKKNVGQGHYLYDGRTYKRIRQLDILPSDIEDIFWSHNDPRVLYYASKAHREQGRFYRVDVISRTRKLVKDFGSLCKGETAIPGGDVQMQSLNDDLFGFRCRDKAAGAKKYKAFTYRISTDEIHSIPLGEGTPYGNWNAPMPSASGKSVYLQGRALTADLSGVIHKLDMAKPGEHSNIGRAYNGQDAIFQVTFNPAPAGCDGDRDKGVGHLVEYNLETGRCRSVISEANGYPYTTSGTHLSAQAYHRPGWVAGSSVGYKKQLQDFESGARAKALFSEIYLANTDPRNTVVCRLAHHRSFGKYAQNAEYPAYFGEPHVTISPSGTRLLFGSDWYDSGSVDTYVVELPGYARQQRAVRNASQSD